MRVCGKIATVRVVLVVITGAPTTAAAAAPAGVKFMTLMLGIMSCDFLFLVVSSMSWLSILGKVLDSIAAAA